MRINIPLGEWLPDLPDAANPGCEVADNVRAVASGYEPISGLTGQGDTVTGEVKGARQMFTSSGGSIIVGGSDTRLFIRRSSVTETTGYTSIGVGEAWDFAQFNDYVIATANGNAPQYLEDIDADTTWVNLPGSPPSAKRCARVGDFLMLGNLSTGPSKIQWSHFNDPTASWTASRLTQAGSATLPIVDGAVQRISGGRYAVVFQERAITRLSYVGPPTVFRADVVSSERGTIAPFSVVQVGYTSFFLAQDGFYVTDGSTVNPIGGRRVNDWFFEEADQSKIRNVHGAVDWQNQCIVWAFAATTSTGFDRLMIYNYIENKWTSGTVNVGWLISTALDGLNLEELDAVYTDLDSIPVSLDSPEFKAKDRRLGAFVTGATTSEYSTFTGDPLEATWVTGEFQPEPGKRVFVDEVAPVLQANDWDSEVTLIMRDHLGRQSTSKTVATGWGGFAPVRGEGHRVAIQLVKPAGEWSEATGLDVKFRISGVR